ncbi:MAG: zinc-ribbon domain-containing protein [Clostridia bacterium]|nr:zinc-ribbon domain-containing protein [Clostridia bacterium]MBQ3955822.1 zinc-ribbon domain-containing protein [Clostridia bacterium]MBQ5355117.1 zinc-ribbon domain-containing protein [Clostridia bacterium]
MANINFDEIKRSATGVADRAMKKTNEVTNLVKLKLAVKSSEGKLSSVYEEIGRLFYTAERSGEDCTSDIAAFIMKADKLKADIASYTKQIAKLRNIRICESCGNEIDQNVNFCPVCGAKQETLVEVAPEVEVTAEECAEDAAECVTDAFEEAKDKAEEFFANIADTVSEKAEDAAEKAEEIAEDAADKVEEVVSDLTDDKE